MALLFTLSLVPFSTSYLGEHHFSREATWLYLATMLLPAFAYVWLQTVIRRTGSQSRDAYAYHRQTTRKGVFATFLYVSGLALTFVSPWLGIDCAALGVLFWFLPTSLVTRLLGGDSSLIPLPESGVGHKTEKMR